MNKTTVSAATVSAYDSINNSLFTFGAIWALSLGYMMPIGCLLTIVFGK